MNTCPGWVTSALTAMRENAMTVMLTRNIRMDRKGGVDFYGILSEDNDGEKGAWVP